MNRVDFHSVSAILFQYLKEADTSQIDYVYMIFASFSNDTEDFLYDNGLVCKWIKGQAKVSPRIINYYVDNAHKKAMSQDIETELFPYLSDFANASMELKELLLSDTSISDFEKERLLSFYIESSHEAYAHFMSEVLIFAMSRPFVRFDAKASTSASPLIDDIILTTLHPKPIKTFVGRDKELDKLYQLTQDYHVLFVHGVPGIGKSELVKQFIKLHRKDYTNILYLKYPGSLFEMIADLDFVDDSDTLTEKERFRKHFRFLKSLKEDSLIVIDNFDTTASNESLLSQVCNLKCTIIFTTRNLFPSYESITITSDKKLAELVLQSNLMDSSDYHQKEIDVILEFLDYHTMAVELVARLLSYATIFPSKLLEQLKENVLLPSDDSKIPLTKDSLTEKSRYQNHMEKLLDMHGLDEDHQKALATIALAPESGIPVKLLYQWYGTCVNEINELSELGFLSIEYHHIKVHPYIRKIINAQKLLTINKCPKIFENIRDTCINEISSYHSLALDMVDTTLRFVKKDNEDIWKRTVFASLERNSRYQRFRSFEKLLNECGYICQHYHNISTENTALLYHFQAVQSAKIHQNILLALELEEKAIFLSTKNGTSQIINLSSMYLDAGRYLSLLGKQEQALEYTKKAADILSNTQMQFTPAGVFTLTSYAKLLYENSNLKDAIQIYTNCIVLVNQVYGEMSITKGYLSQNIAAICSSTGNSKMAMLYYSQAENILKQYLEPEDHDLLLCQQQLGDLKLQLSSQNIPYLLSVPDQIMLDNQIA